MRAAISNFAAGGTENKVLWLGAMKEMGKEEEKEHQDLVTYIRQYDWKNVVLVGKEFNNIRNEYQWFETSDEAATFIIRNKPHAVSILIKGSRGSKMEKLLEALKN